MKAHLDRMSLLLVCLLVPAMGGRTWASSSLPETFDLMAVDAYLAEQVSEGGLPGLSVAVVQKGRLVWAKGYGLASLPDRRPVQTNTLFAIGSVSKQFTCACVLLLAEEGRLSVHDPVARYYPKLTRAEDITLLDLMNHTSGYPDYYPLDFVDRRMQQPIDPDDLLRRYAGAALDFDPGTQWSYSNTGYILLGRIVEKVSGQPFGDVLKQRILLPLGLHHTLYEPDPNQDRLAKGYLTFALGPPESNRPEAPGWIGAAGGLWSTPSDLARWDLALVEGKILKPESYALLTRPRALADGRLVDYGCGVSVRTMSQRLVLSHSGAVSGFNTWNGTIPSTRSALVLSCNQDDGLGDLPNRLLALFLRESPAIPAVRGPGIDETVRACLSQLQAGVLDRPRYSAEFNAYVTDDRLAGASERLKPYGKPRRVDILRTRERGGMEVSVARLHCDQGLLRSLMYRRPDGIIEQFFVYPDNE